MWWCWCANLCGGSGLADAQLQAMSRLTVLRCVGPLAVVSVRVAALGSLAYRSATPAAELVSLPLCERRCLTYVSCRLLLLSLRCSHSPGHIARMCPAAGGFRGGFGGRGGFVYRPRVNVNPDGTPVKC